MRQLFRISSNRAAAFDPMSAIFPAGDAPVVRLAEDGDRELVLSSWGFPLLVKGQAPKRVTNTRDDKLGSSFWAPSFRERRCLVPVTSFAEPQGKRPATWHWFALDETRSPFAFAGIRRRYKEPLRPDGETVEMDVHSFLTTKPNKLVATIHPTRMPVMLTREEEWEIWLQGSADEARGLIRSYPAEEIQIVRSGLERKVSIAADSESPARRPNAPFTGPPRVASVLTTLPGTEPASNGCGDYGQKYGLIAKGALKTMLSNGSWWRGLDSNQRRHSQRIYSPPPLATRAPLHRRWRIGRASANAP